MERLDQLVREYNALNKLPFHTAELKARIIALKNEIEAILAEIRNEKQKEQQFLKDQELLQAAESTKQQELLTAQAEAKKRQEEEKIRLLQEELLAGKQKTEQEKQIAAQQMQKAQQELAKANLAAKLAQQGGEGDVAAAKSLLGTWESKGVNPWMIAGISVGALVVGVIIFKILR